MELLDLVDRLENMTAQAKKMPMTSMSMLDAEQMLGLIDQLRVAVPRSIHDAQELIERREQIVNQTMIDARRIRTTAEGDARLLVDETEMVKAAQVRTEEIIQDANSKADRIISPRGAGGAEAPRRRGRLQPRLPEHAGRPRLQHAERDPRGPARAAACGQPLPLSAPSFLLNARPSPPPDGRGGSRASVSVDPLATR